MHYGMALVVGLSMAPTLIPGERLLVKYGAPIAPGDLVIFNRVGQVDIKRVFRIESGGLFLLGDNASVSVDSRTYGLILLKDVLGSTAIRLWPKPGRITCA